MKCLMSVVVAALMCGAVVAETPAQEVMVAFNGDPLGAFQTPPPVPAQTQNQGLNVPLLIDLLKMQDARINDLMLRVNQLEGSNAIVFEGLTSHERMLGEMHTEVEKVRITMHRVEGRLASQDLYIGGAWNYMRRLHANLPASGQKNVSNLANKTPEPAEEFERALMREYFDKR